MLFGHLYIFFGEISIQVLCPSLNGLFLLLLLLSFRGSLYILVINPLSDIWFANIFSHSIGWFFFTLLIVYFDAQKFFFLINSYFIYLFIFSSVGSSFRARAFSSCGKRGPLFIAVRGPLTIAAPPVAGHRLQTLRLSSCGSWAQLLRGMWDLPRPGLEPVSPALAGRFSTTAPPGKPHKSFNFEIHFI